MPIDLPDEMKSAFETCLADGAPVLFATASRDGMPDIAFKGSAMVFDKENVAFWERALGQTYANLKENPGVCVLYRNAATRVAWKMFGQAEVLTEGTGKKPKATDNVEVHYEGKLTDGTEFDSSVKRGQPAAFRLDQVIPGWTEGVQLMKEGGKTRFTIPANLAYGEMGAGTIPPNSVLIFEVELLKIIKEETKADVKKAKKK